MAYPLTSGAAKHHVTRVLGMTTVSLVAAAENANVIAVTVQLTDVAGNTIASADAWEATIVGEPVADYSIAETGAGSPLNVTAHNACAFTLSTGGAATLSVTDVSGASNEAVVLSLKPLDSMAVPNYITLTFD